MPERAPLHAATTSAPPSLQERVAGAILEAAARVVSRADAPASMADVAHEAGVARATLYRYYPSRGDLLAELARQTTRDAGARLSASRIDEVAPAEGIRRSVRALVEVGDGFVAVARERVKPDAEEEERLVVAPIRQVIERGQAAGDIRRDVSPALLGEALIALTASMLAARPAQGRDDAIEAITSLFLDGTRIRGSGVNTD
jgi:TetR/AcrR family transcriptional regulator, mexCD-oprJ operon repressor